MAGLKVHCPANAGDARGLNGMVVLGSADDLRETSGSMAYAYDGVVGTRTYSTLVG